MIYSGLSGLHVNRFMLVHISKKFAKFDYTVYFIIHTRKQTEVDI